MRQEIIAIFDIGKTNKKLLLFDTALNLISSTEEKFQQVTDDDGFECDNIDLVEKWIRETVNSLVLSAEYDLKGINFTTYGASLAYLDGHGKRTGPVYNYLKPLDPGIAEQLYGRYGGKEEFCRVTASPALGMLNSGLQALWLKRIHPEVFSRVKTILHFPQYLSYCLTGEIYSEHTSIGCHTATWDFDSGSYHQWVADEALPFAQPVPVTTLFTATIKGRKIRVGTGLHDSSASLAPYFSGKRGNFILLSTGTWCIAMNPFNGEKLTTGQLARDCLCYMDINGNPVKSSRLFLGSMHDRAVSHLSRYFKIPESSFMLIKPDARILSKLMEKVRDEKVFAAMINNQPLLKDEPDLFVFNNSIESYHLLMAELTDLAIESVNLIIPEDDATTDLFITGGFSKNLLFRKLVASSYPHLAVYTSEISNATALGAAVVTLSALDPGSVTAPELGLSEVKL
ncbi:MAG TPA: FGGY family carbohydrate kinase [Bacteroidales bacterium]|nr:FGGY family carbohydrate kinase [Bacteroidales bacterium]